MALPPSPVLTPRRAPAQARSRATVGAIHEAGFQVLLRVGPRRLTTTLVAERAGVSVGTLYQYYPNRSALLAALLGAHLDTVVERVEQACSRQHGATIEAMVGALVAAFVKAKFARPDLARSLYAVLAETDGARQARTASTRAARAVAAMLGTCPELRLDAPEHAASVLCETLSAVVQAALVAEADPPNEDALRRDLEDVALGYLERVARMRIA